MYDNIKTFVNGWKFPAVVAVLLVMAFVSHVADGNTARAVITAVLVVSWTYVARKRRVHA